MKEGKKRKAIRPPQQINMCTLAIPAVRTNEQIHGLVGATENGSLPVADCDHVVRSVSPKEQTNQMHAVAEVAASSSALALHVHADDVPRARDEVHIDSAIRVKRPRLEYRVKEMFKCKRVVGTEEVDLVPSSSDECRRTELCCVDPANNEDSSYDVMKISKKSILTWNTPSSKSKNSHGYSSGECENVGTSAVKELRIDHIGDNFRTMSQNILSEERVNIDDGRFRIAGASSSACLSDARTPADRLNVCEVVLPTLPASSTIALLEQPKSNFGTSFHPGDHTQTTIDDGENLSSEVPRANSGLQDRLYTRDTEVPLRPTVVKECRIYENIDKSDTDGACNEPKPDPLSNCSFPDTYSELLQGNGSTSCTTVNFSLSPESISQAYNHSIRCMNVGCSQVCQYFKVSYSIYSLLRILLFFISK